MEYEIVTLEEKIAVGIAARTNNLSPDMGAVIGGLWNRFYNEGISASIEGKVNGKALGIYTAYAKDEKADYTAMVAYETTGEPQGETFPVETADVPQGKAYAVCRIPAGRYAKFIIHGDMVQAVAAAWQQIWEMQLPRAFQCDFEEYQDGSMDNAEVHIYVSLTEDGQGKAESRCGLLCSACEYREQMNCKGCIQIEKPFWGDRCPVKA